MTRRERYAKYRATSGWRERSRAERDRAGGYCEQCGAGGKVEVHHLTYDSVDFDNPGAELPEHLIVLCRRCHQAQHGDALPGEDFRAFDHGEYAHLASYHKMVQSIVDFFDDPAHGGVTWAEGHKILRDVPHNMMLAGDCCETCEIAHDAWDAPYRPFAMEPSYRNGRHDGWRAQYVCKRGHRWACGFARGSRAWFLAL